MGASIVSGVDAPPVFEAAEHVLDLMTLIVEDGVKALRFGALRLYGIYGDAISIPLFVTLCVSQLCS